MSVLKIKRTNGTWYTVEGSFTSTVVSVLPQTGEEGVLYLTPTLVAGNYSAHLWKNSAWLHVGGSGGGAVDDVQIDGQSIVVGGVANIPLGNYSTTTQMNTAIAAHHDSTKEDTSNKVQSISSASTNTEYPTAKLLYDKYIELKEIAEGKTKSYSASATTNPALDSTADAITIASFVDINGKTITASQLNVGDNIYITETNKIDRWCAGFANNLAILYQIETVKPPVTDVWQNGTTVMDGTIAKITVPAQKTKLSEFTDDLGSSPTHTHSQYAVDNDLAAVAKSGSYNDLSNQPTIPAAANDGTITITQGGVTKGSFTTNQAGNATIALDNGGVQSDWSEDVSTDPAYIKNKPVVRNIAFQRGGIAAGTIGVYGPSQDQTINIENEVAIGTTQPTDPNNELWLDTTETTPQTWEDIIGLAQSNTAGLIKATPKTSSMTAEVGIDSSTGKLYVEPGGGGGGQSASFSSNKLVFTGGTPVQQGYLLVTSLAGATVTVGSDSYTYGAEETSHNFGPYDYGTYTVTANKTGMYEKSISAPVAAATNTCSCCPTKVPSGYTELSYIQSSGSQYLDLNFIPTKNTDIELDFSSQDIGQVKGFFGEYNSSSDCFELQTGGVSSADSTEFYYTKNASLVFTNSRTFDRCILKTENNKLYKNDAELGTISRNNFTTTLSFILFSLRVSTVITNYCSKMTVYGCTIQDNNSLVRKLIPAKRDSDNAIGMYDTVSSTFFENSGTGTFIPGDPV